MRFPEFSGEWEDKKIKDCYRIRGGYAFKSEHFKQSGIPIVRISNLPQKSSIVDLTDCVYYDEGNYSDYEIHNGDLLIAMSGATTGKTARFIGKEKAYQNQRVGCFVLKNNAIIYPFVYPLVESVKFQKSLDSKLIAGAQPNISSADIEELPLSFPTSLEEQKKISNLFSFIDKRIETQKKIIEELKKLKSAIREKVFKQVELSCKDYTTIGEMLDYEQPTEYLVDSTEYSDSHSIPVLTANKAYILGFTDETYGVYEKGECIIFDDFTMDVKYVDFPFKVKSSAIKILSAKEDVDLYFMYEYFQYLGLVSEEHKRHYISEIEPLNIVRPSLNTQRRFSIFLRSIDKSISFAIKLSTQYTKQKDYLLSQMFI